MTAKPGTERLRAHLRRHNRNVVLLTFVTFLAAAFLWGALYLVAWWAFALFNAVSQPTSFVAPPRVLFPAFAATGLLLCLCAWAVRKLRPNQRVPDRKGWFGHLLDIVLAVPRVTLTIFGTSGAATRLNQSELDYAWRLLRQMEDVPGSYPIQSVPVEIPDAATRDKILLALQLSGLIELRSSQDGPVLAFRDDAARRLVQHRARIRV